MLVVRPSLESAIYAVVKILEAHVVIPDDIVLFNHD
jgi:hypothetical protein